MTFFPFKFDTAQDRVLFLGVVWAFRQQNLPLPENAGFLLSLAEEKDLDVYYDDICHLTRPGGMCSHPAGLDLCCKGLEILGHFHQGHCDQRPDCLGERVHKKLRELHAVKRG